MRDDSTEIFLPVFSLGGHREQLRNGQGRPLFDVVRPGFLLPTAGSPTLQGALMVLDGFGKMVLERLSWRRYRPPLIFSKS